MRISEKTKVTISHDTLGEPKSIRFSEDFEDIDFTLLKEVVVRQETFPVGSHVIQLNNIAQGKFLYIKPSKDLQVSINGASAQTFRGLKASKMWMTVTALTIITTDIQEVLIVCAGE